MSGCHKTRRYYTNVDKQINGKSGNKSVFGRTQTGQKTFSFHRIISQHDQPRTKHASVENQPNQQVFLLE